MVRTERWSWAAISALLAPAAAMDATSRSRRLNGMRAFAALSKWCSCTFALGSEGLAATGGLRGAGNAACLRLYPAGGSRRGSS